MPCLRSRSKWMRKKAIMRPHWIHVCVWSCACVCLWEPLRYHAIAHLSITAQSWSLLVQFDSHNNEWCDAKTLHLPTALQLFPFRSIVSLDWFCSTLYLSKRNLSWKNVIFFIAAVKIGWKMLPSLVIYWDGNQTHPVYYGVWVHFDLLSVESHNMLLLIWLLFTLINKQFGHKICAWSKAFDLDH